MTTQAPVCAVCGGPCELLGTLGSIDHFRCRNCGMTQSQPTEPVEDEVTIFDVTAPLPFQFN